MDFVDRLSSFGSSRRGVNMDSVFKFTDLSSATQQHLANVYTTLALTLAVCAAGTWFNIITGFGSTLGIFLWVITTVWLLGLPATPQNQFKRGSLLGGAAFSNGMVLGPLVGSVLAVQPGIVMTALLGTSAVFACFSGAALLSRRRSYLYLGGVLSSVISTMLMMRFASWIFGGRALMFQAELYLGGLVFLGYVLFDTQLIVEKAELGDRDTIRAALDLFVDFVAIFVRLLIILSQNAEQKEKEDERRRRRRGGR